MDEKTKKDKLSEIFESDLLGLLTVDEPKTAPVSPQDSRLIDSFQEISDFYETNQRCPELGDDIGEYRLASRLAAIKKDPKKVKTLLPYDYYNLLESEETKSVSVEELISDDPLGFPMLNHQRDFVPITLLIEKCVKISIFMKRLSSRFMTIWNMVVGVLWNSKKAICMKDVTMFFAAWFFTWSRTWQSNKKSSIRVAQKFAVKVGRGVSSIMARNPPCSIVLLERLSNLMAFV